MPDDDDQRTVKELIGEGRLPIDPQTQADLEKWFGLPSVTALQEEGKIAAAQDSEIAEVVERRRKALESIDPALLDEIRLRTEDIPNPIGQPVRTIEPVIDDSIALFDMGMVDRALTIAEPRTVEIPDQLIDDLRDCTPQALLRDLHRPEQFFDKVFEIVDAAAAQRIDIVAEVKSAMRTSWRLPAFGRKAIEEGHDVLRDLRKQRSQPWISFLPFLPHRSVQE